MPFKTFTSTALSSSDMNTYLMKQSVITCTSGTRPSSPVEGMQIYETDTDLIAIYDGSAWGYLGGYTSYTPTLANLTLGNGTMTGEYRKIGKDINFSVVITFGSTTVMGTSPTISLPVTANSANFAGAAGFAVDASAGASGRYPLTGIPTTTIINPVSASGLLSATIPFTWTTSDIVSIGGTYRAA